MMFIDDGIIGLNSMVPICSVPAET